MLVILWAVFSLGRIVVGPRHAVLAVLLMAGIAAFSVPTPEFGPALLAAALWALILLHYWRAVGQGRRIYWLAVGFEAGLLLLTTYSGVLLIGLLLAFALISKRGREQFTWPEPYIGGAILILVFYRHLVWIEQTNLLDTVSFAGLAAIADNAWTWLGLLGLLVMGHAGLIVLVLLGRGFTLSPRGPAAEVERAPVDPDARTFVYCLCAAACRCDRPRRAVHRPRGKFPRARAGRALGAGGDRRWRRIASASSTSASRSTPGRCCCCCRR